MRSNNGKTGNGKIGAAIICFLLAAIGLEQGEDGLVMTLFFAGIGVLLIYLKVTEKERQRKRNEQIAERNKRKAEEEKNKTIQAAMSRFGNSNFVARLIQDFRIRNWSDLNCGGGGCQVFEDKIVTPHKTYLYDDFGLNRLDPKGCEQLAVYIGELFGREYEVKEMTRAFGGYTGGYSGYVGSDGSISVSRDYSGGTTTLGYKVYSVSSKPSPKPQGKNW